VAKDLVWYIDENGNAVPTPASEAPARELVIALPTRPVIVRHCTIIRGSGEHVSWFVAKIAH
jgi:hypothetical protein